MERIDLMRSIILSAAALVALAGCNTISGFGKDLQTLGGAMTRVSDDVADGNTRSASNDVELCGGSGASRRGNC